MAVERSRRRVLSQFLLTWAACFLAIVAFMAAVVGMVWLIHAHPVIAIWFGVVAASGLASLLITVARNE